MSKMQMMGWGKKAVQAALVMAMSASSAFAALQFIPSAPGVFQSPVSAGAVSENFDAFTIGGLGASGSTANGPYTTTGSPVIKAANNDGGAGGIGRYPFTNGGGTVSVSLTNPSKYVGFWWSTFSLSDTDNVKIYGNTGGGAETLLATLDASMITAIVGTQASPKTFTAMDGNTYSGSQYWGNSGAAFSTANTLYLYMNVQMSDPTANITRVEFGGNYMEFDNLTTSTVWQSALAAAVNPAPANRTVPALSEWALLALAGALALLTGFRLHRRQRL